MKKYKTIWILPVVTIAIALTGCFERDNVSENQAELTKVRFAISAYQDSLLPILGSEEHLDLYRKEGLDVQFSILDLSSAREGLIGGSFDVIWNNMGNVIVARSNGAPLVYAYGVNTFDEGFAIMVRNNSDFKTYQEFIDDGLDEASALTRAALQLKQKEIITLGDTDFEQFVSDAVTMAGLHYSRSFEDGDTRLLNFDPQSGFEAFVGGDGDAYLGGIPQRDAAEDRGMKTLFTGADLGSAVINGFVTTESYAKNNSDTIEALLRAWFKIVTYVEENTDEAASKISVKMIEETGKDFTSDDFKRFWQKFEYFPVTPEDAYSRILAPDGVNYWRKRWNASNTFFIGVGTISEQISPDGVFLMDEFHKRLTSGGDGS